MTLDISHQSSIGKLFISASIIVLPLIMDAQEQQYVQDPKLTELSKIRSECEKLLKDSSLSKTELQKNAYECRIKINEAFLPIAYQEVERRKNMLMAAIERRDDENTIDSLKTSLLGAMSDKNLSEINIIIGEKQLKGLK